MIHSLDKFRKALVLTQSAAFSPMYEMHRSRNIAVHLGPEGEFLCLILSKYK